MEQRRVRVAQQISHSSATAKVLAVGPPGAYSSIRPMGAFQDCRIVILADRVAGGPHFSRVSIAPCKDVRYPKSAVTEGARTSFAAFYSRVVLHLGSGRGIEHDEMHAGALALPDARE